MATEQERLDSIMTGIHRSYKGIPDDNKVAAMKFIVAQSRKHRYLCGGNMLEKWRSQNTDPRHPANTDWRNKWGGIFQRLSSLGVLRKHGRIRPTSKQSHSASLVLWESIIYKGDQPEMRSVPVVLDRLLNKVHARDMSFKDALWKAYEYGTER